MGERENDKKELKRKSDGERNMALTLTMASLVWAMSDMTPSVMMSRTKYWEPSCTVAA